MTNTSTTEITFVFVQQTYYAKLIHKLDNIYAEAR